MSEAQSKAKYLVLDTETTGLFDFKQPADAPAQPRLASVAFVYADENGNVISSEKYYIAPDGWEMPEEAKRINGLSTEFLTENGVPVIEVLDRYIEAIEEGLIITAFNAQFDTKIMRAELRRAQRDDLFEHTTNVCLMRSLVNVCKKNGNRGYRWPKLSEALAFFGLEQDNAHDALSDATAACDILKKMIERDLLPRAKVHYAKRRPEQVQIEDEDCTTWPKFTHRTRTQNTRAGRTSPSGVTVPEDFPV